LVTELYFDLNEAKNKATATKPWALREIHTRGGNAQNKQRKPIIVEKLIKFNTELVSGARKYKKKRFKIPLT
jgi:hypothetical protein